MTTYQIIADNGWDVIMLNHLDLYGDVNFRDSIHNVDTNSRKLMNCAKKSLYNNFFFSQQHPQHWQ